MQFSQNFRQSLCAHQFFSTSEYVKAPKKAVLSVKGLRLTLSAGALIKLPEREREREREKTNTTGLLGGFSLIEYRKKSCHGAPGPELSAAPPAVPRPPCTAPWSSTSAAVPRGDSSFCIQWQFALFMRLFSFIC